MTTRHVLKSWPEIFQPMLEGTKTFDVRNDERRFNVGDTLVLREYDPKTGNYSGREIKREVMFVLMGGGAGSTPPYHGVARGFVVLSLTPVE